MGLNNSLASNQQDKGLDILSRRLFLFLLQDRSFQYVRRTDTSRCKGGLANYQEGRFRDSTPIPLLVGRALAASLVSIAANFRLEVAWHARMVEPTEDNLVWFVLEVVAR